MKLMKLLYAGIDTNGGYGASFDTDDGAQYQVWLGGPHLRSVLEFRGDSQPADCPDVLSDSPQETALLHLLDEFLLNPVLANPSLSRDPLRRLRKMRDFIARPGRLTAKTFSVLNKSGDSLDDPSRSEMWEFLCDLDSADEKQRVARISNANALLEWNGNGRLVFKCRQSGDARHMLNVSREAALDHWMALAEGQMSALEAAPWSPGDGRGSPSRRQVELREAQLRDDREFYDSLGAERSEHRCRVDGCSRGTVNFSVCCRPHHFASIRGTPSPFDD